MWGGKFTIDSVPNTMLFNFTWVSNVTFDSCLDWQNSDFFSRDLSFFLASFRPSFLQYVFLGSWKKICYNCIKKGNQEKDHCKKYGAPKNHYPRVGEDNLPNDLRTVYEKLLPIFTKRGRILSQIYIFRLNKKNLIHINL